MKETISNCASPAREPFLRAFAIAGGCFFFVLPFMALLLFLFASNCSLARNLTLIAGLSQVLCARRFFFLSASWFLLALLR